MLQQAEQKKSNVSEEPIQYNRTYGIQREDMEGSKTSALEQEHTEQLID